MEIFPDEMVPFGSLNGGQCPGCGEVPLGRVAGCDAPHFLCRSCGHCWSFATGTWGAVDPIGCPGCASHDRVECIEQLAAEFPRFGPSMLD